MKILLLNCIIGILSLTIIQAQSPLILWGKNFGGSQDETLSKIISTSDGKFLCVGSTISNDVDVSGNHGAKDYWIIKLDEEGELLWQKCYGGSQDDEAMSVVEVENGFIVVGHSLSADGDVSINYGLNDVWVIKIDSIGNLEWERSYGGSQQDWARSVTVTEENRFLINSYTGSYDGDVSESYGGRDIWLFQINKDGDLLNEKTIGGADRDEAYSVIQTLDSGFLISGITGSFIDYGGGYSSESLLMKTDHNLDLIWDLHYAPTYLSIWTDAVQLQDSSYALIEVLDDGGQLDIGIAIFQEDSGVAGKTVYADGHEYPSDLLITQDSMLLICGSATNERFDISEVYGNFGYPDFWICKTDLSGNIIWEENFGGGYSDYATSALQLETGQFIIAGNTDTASIDVEAHNGGWDFWIIKICNPVKSYADIDGDGFGDMQASSLACELPVGYVLNDEDCYDGNALVNPSAEEILNGIDDDCDGIIDEGLLSIEISGSLSGIEVYPNPTSGFLNIEQNKQYHKSKPLVATLMTSTGTIITCVELTFDIRSIHTIDLRGHGLSPGLYFLNISGEEKVEKNYKLIVTY